MNRFPVFLSSFSVGVLFLVFLVSFELFYVLEMSQGFFTYTLDDPYIHLALAENIKNGHYGINISEFSAPSSSALWPLLLAPVSGFVEAPFIINLLLGVGVVFIVDRILRLSGPHYSSGSKRFFWAFITSLFVLSTNVVGLIFSGMEHSFQVFLVLVIAYGVIVEVEVGKVNWWLLLAIISAPLVRYECLAISVSALIYLFSRGHLKPVSFSVFMLLIGLGGFALFLQLNGLESFPSSVTAKSVVVQHGVGIDSVLYNIKKSFSYRQGLVLFSMAVCFLIYSMWERQNSGKRALALTSLLAIFLHFLAGDYGWYHRYEIYILAFSLIVGIYLLLPLICTFFDNNGRRSDAVKMAIVAAGLASVVGGPYIKDLLTIPLASNNIYEQQYQIHRFVTEFYGESIAVNDLGYVSYRNDLYVLDLWGLGSEEVLRNRLEPGLASAWMREAVVGKNVQLVVIYEEWFNSIPKEWVKIGDLHLGKPRITPARSYVSFYVTSKEMLEETMKKVAAFSQTLPSGVVFSVVSNG